jgi:UDP-N-acetylglucosamine diphosphorylase/glucosamine-1-phosphate N-acetyltransferase
MSDARLYLFDDHRGRRWAPFTLTRPVGELLFGCMSLRARAELVLDRSCAGHLTRRALAGFDEPGAAPATSWGAVETDEARILLSSRTCLEFQTVKLPTEAATLWVDDRVVGWVLPPGMPTPSEDAIRRPETAGLDGIRVDLEGVVLERPWDLVHGNDERIGKDIAHLWSSDDAPDSIFRVGNHPVSMAEGAEIEPGVHVDVRSGPIRLAEGARVEGPARLVGPLFVGRGSTILGGQVGSSTIGPVCLVRGEVAHSVLLGYVNKAHDGHLGHAVVGRWVNLGAFTTNSDLKNNYRSVRVWSPDGEIDTGLIKVGCFLGDHVKTGIGTVLNTGTVIGAGSNVFGGLMPPTVIPPFSWGAGVDFRDHRLDKFFETTERVMKRRGEALTPGVRQLLSTAWDATAGRRAV